MTRRTVPPDDAGSTAAPVCGLTYLSLRAFPRHSPPDPQRSHYEGQKRMTI